jgi:hypothetical protein
MSPESTRKTICTHSRRHDEIATGNCVDETAAAGLNQPIERRTMPEPESPLQGAAGSPAADGTGQDTHAPSASSAGGWDFAAFGAFLRSSDEAWVRRTSAGGGPSLVSALTCLDCGPKQRPGIN